LREAFLPEGRIELGRGFADEDAFISPDEPIPYRVPRSVTIRHPDTAPSEVRGIVTGIGDNPHLDPAELAVSGDPGLMEVVEKITKLAESLRRKGEAALRTTPEMSRFDATVRAYCVGYLAGRRAEEEEG
jgi:hypothetical protein